MRLEGKVALVSGGGNGMGAEECRLFAREGARVAIGDIREEDGRRVEAEIAEAGGEAMFVNLNVAVEDSWVAAVEQVVARFGKLDVLVNNAGGGSGRGAGALLARDPAAAAELITANLTGVLHWCQETARHMLPAGRGRIINIASVAGMVGRDRAMYHRNSKTEQPVDYAAAKGGVIGLTLDLAGSLSPRGIRVNSISPGGFDKGDLPQRFVADYASVTMLGRMGRFGVDLKGAALFLASAASDYVTGHNLVVDGGFSVWK
jgi:NAD(P)-dependent dehydrogenase (short-subunit alcohol dehydrogenase family)